MFCFRRRGNDLLQEVRKGFGLEGLDGLEGKITADGEEPSGKDRAVTIRQRQRFHAATRDLVLPAFMIEDHGEWRLVHYESDILSRVPWDEVDLSPLFDLQLREELADQASRVGLETEALAQEAGTRGSSSTAKDISIDYYFAASHLLDVMPNPWRGSEAARQVFAALLSQYPFGRVASNYVFVFEELRKRLGAERDRLSQHVFQELLAAGAMRFIVVTEDLEFNRLPSKIETIQARQANREDGSQYERNLFDLIHEDDLNGLENKVATYLDQQERLFSRDRYCRRYGNRLRGASV